MQQQIITRKFSKDDKYRHFEVPFEVPENTDILVLDIEMVNRTGEEAIVDIGVKDPEIIRGWTGSDKKHIVITKEYATGGYLPGAIQKGEWNFLLSVYKVPSTGCELIMKASLHEKRFRWFKGDTHTHTLHSDGNRTIEDMVKVCRELEFDYLVSTNHNTVSQNMILPTDRDMILIPGVELTTYKGHANIFGLRRPFKDFRCRTKEEVLSKFAEVRANGGHIGLNHPFADDCEGCNWTWGYDFPYEWIEVWNSAWSHMNQNALGWWHGLLCEGRQVPVIGGTDVHKIILYNHAAVPATYVYADAVDADAIIGGMLRGRVFISSIDNGPIVEMSTPNGQMMGDLTADRKAYVSISNLKESDEVRIISDKGTELKHISGNMGGFEYEFTRDSSQKFIRVEVGRNIADKPNVVLISNPVYFK